MLKRKNRTLGKGRIIPYHYKGAQSATAYTIKTRSSAAADTIFDKARQRLLNVNNWQAIAGPASASFTVINKQNEETHAPAKEGDYFRISIPVIPKTETGDGFDWVRVEKIEERQDREYQFVGIRVRPCEPPFDKHEVAHFFSPHATSTFCVERIGNRVKAAVYGRNEQPNTKKAIGLFTTLRNLVIALGAMMGLNKPQWKGLVKGLLTGGIEEKRSL